MGTGQLLLAVLDADEAGRMVEAHPPFEGHRPVPLQTVAALSDGYLLYATPDLPEEHARLVAQALDHAGLGRAPAKKTPPAHPGAAAFWTEGARPG
jgi:hypothetical protein